MSLLAPPAFSEQSSSPGKPAVLDTHTPLECLLLVLYVGSFGVSDDTFSRISSVLLLLDHITTDPSFNGERLAPARLSSRFVQLVKEELIRFVEDERVLLRKPLTPNQGRLLTGYDSIASQAHAISSLQDALKFARIVPRLACRLYDNFIETQVRLIRHAEEDYFRLRKEMDELAEDERNSKTAPSNDPEDVIMVDAPEHHLSEPPSTEPTLNPSDSAGTSAKAQVPTPSREKAASPIRADKRSKSPSKLPDAQEPQTPKPRRPSHQAGVQTEPVAVRDSPSPSPSCQLMADLGPNESSDGDSSVSLLETAPSSAAAYPLPHRSNFLDLARRVSQILDSPSISQTFSARASYAKNSPSGKAEAPGTPAVSAPARTRSVSPLSDRHWSPSGSDDEETPRPSSAVDGTKLNSELSDRSTPGFAKPVQSKDTIHASSEPDRLSASSTELAEVKASVKSESPSPRRNTPGAPSSPSDRSPSVTRANNRRRRMSKSRLSVRSISDFDNSDGQSAALETDSDRIMPRADRSTVLEADSVSTPASASLFSSFIPQTRPTYVVATRNFPRLSNPIMYEVLSHKHASLFAHPVKEKDAEGYHDMIKRPQDLKSIRVAMGAGSRGITSAIAAATDDDAIAILDSTATVAASPNASVSAAASTPTTGTGAGTSTVTGTSSTVNTTAMLGNASTLYLPLSADLIPPNSIVNSGQLQCEMTRMFANAVMFSPGEDGIVKDAREMYDTVSQTLRGWRQVEKAGLGKKGVVAIGVGIDLESGVVAAVSGSGATSAGAGGPGDLTSGSASHGTPRFCTSEVNSGLNAKMSAHAGQAQPATPPSIAGTPTGALSLLSTDRGKRRRRSSRFFTPVAASEREAGSSKSKHGNDVDGDTSDRDTGRDTADDATVKTGLHDQDNDNDGDTEGDGEEAGGDPKTSNGDDTGGDGDADPDVDADGDTQMLGAGSERDGPAVKTSAPRTRRRTSVVSPTATVSSTTSRTRRRRRRTGD